MGISLLREEDKGQWDKYVMETEATNCYHLSGWKDVIERSFGHKTYYLFAEENGVIRGILPLVHMKSLIFGSFMVSLPYFNYGGVCSNSKEIYNQLLNECVRIAKKKNVGHIELRHVESIDGSLPAKTTKVSMRLSLPQNTDELWDSLPSKLRSQIRRPQKEEMYARFGGEDELESFYKVFSLNMRDLGTPVYSKSFFKNILREFPESSRICTVYTRDGQPAASGFLVGFKDILEIPWASSLRSYNSYSPNMLLYWEVLKFACEKGYKLFDFGRSTTGEGTYKFKEQWGAKPVQLYWHYWLKNGGQLPELNPDNPKYQMVIKTWQRLPVGLTKIIGPMIVRNIP